MDRLGSETCPGVKRSPHSQKLRFLSTGSNPIFPPACLLDTDRRRYCRSGENCVALICPFRGKTTVSYTLQKTQVELLTTSDKPVH